MKHVNFISVFCGLLFAATIHAKGPIEFYQEEITMSVNDSSVRIDGVYYFKNNTSTSGPMPVLFPFYVDSLSEYPSFVRAYTISDSGDTIDVKIKHIREQNRVHLTIPLIPKQISKWYIEYVQKIHSTSARYVLTSTAAWGEPLKDAAYKFKVPAEYRDVKTWPEADSSNANGNNSIYWSTKKDFMPRQDMTIYWLRKIEK